MTGVLNAKDYFRLSDRSRQSVLAGAVSPAYFVPETIKADVLFRNMRKNRQSMAVVLDEYGGVVGIITLNDLLEELVGDLSDTPEDGTEERIEQEDEATWRITGNIALDEIEKTTGLDLRSGDYETFTGMAFDALGMVLGDEDKDVKLDLPGLSVTIVRVKDHQIAEAVLHIREGE